MIRRKLDTIDRLDKLVVTILQLSFALDVEGRQEKDFDRTIKAFAGHLPVVTNIGSKAFLKGIA